jgi:hypothetical protein
MAISTISLGKVKFNWRGTWAGSTAYVKDDVISYGANAYIVTTSHTSTLVFADNANKMDIMVQGVENAGVYSNSTLYKVNDIVTYGGAVYIAIQSSTGQSPTNATYWSSLVGGFQYLSTYSGSVTYKKGDIVSYGGNSYIATQDTINHLPTDIVYWTLFVQGFSLQTAAYSGSTAYKIGQVVTYGANSYVTKLDSTGNAPTNTTYWAQLTSGQISTGTYSDANTYKNGDLVQYGGYVYVCILATTGNNPSNTTYWSQAQTGFKWLGLYSGSATYQKGEVVNFNGSSFVSLAFDNLNNVPEGSPSYWTLMMQGSANNVYTTAGDIAYRGVSAVSRLPAGTTGQVLSIDNSTGLPIWENNGVTGNVYYVATTGVDAVNYGSTMQRPFASLQYACQNVTTPCTIFVKAGSYYENLPISVPASCAIIGDSLRNTFIYPKTATAVTRAFSSINVPITQATYSNGNATYLGIRTTVLASLSTIQASTITYLNQTSTSYNQARCYRDVGYIVKAVLADLVFASNYQSTKAGLSYLTNYASVVTAKQKAQTLSGINKARDLVLTYTADAGAISAITSNFAIVTNIINTGVSAFDATALTYGNPSGVAVGYSNAKAILAANRTFMQAELVAWLTVTYDTSLITGYSSATFSRNVGYIIDALTYDMLYSGNSQTVDTAKLYYSGVVAIDAAYGRLKTIIQQVVQNQTVTKSSGNSQTQNVSLSAGTSAAGTTLAGLIDNLLTIESDGGLTITVTTNTTGIIAGMQIAGTGFESYQKVSAVVNSTKFKIDYAPEATPTSMTFNFLSNDPVPVVNNLSTMFYLSDATLLKQMSYNGMTGFALSNSDTQDITTATIGGVFARLNPASPILTKSPYITDCSCFSTGGTGVIVDGSVHSVGNKSMVFHAYTNIHDNGVGFWIKDNAKAEIVSCFTYYCYFGYATSGGAKIRSLNGNNSYGLYGVVSRGYDVTETPITGTLYGEQITYNSNSLSGNGFSTSDTIQGLTSGARGTVTNVQSGSYKVYYKKIGGTSFTSGETIVGSSSGTSAVIATGGASGQKGFVLVVTGLTSKPSVGTSIEMDNDQYSYVIQSVGTWINSSSIVQIVLAQEKPAGSPDATALRVRTNFSQSRLTGHDFLSIGTGGVTTTNYPGLPTQSAAPGNQTIEVFPGRVFYVATDQDGNFKVGNYFAVNQATGTATLNANAFNLSGLAALRLGSVGAQLGELISEFSSDVTLGADVNTKVPTQHAVKTYVDTKTNASTQLTLGTYPLQTIFKLTGTGASTDTVDVQIGGTTGILQIAQQYLQVPKGTTLDRQSLSASSGFTRYNTTINSLEVYNGAAWVPAGGFNNVSVNALQSPYTASTYQFIFATTSGGAITVNLPNTANLGDQIRFIDVAGTFGTNNLTIAPNGGKIYGTTDNLVVNNNNAGFALVYTGATYGWKILEV